MNFEYCCKAVRSSSIQGGYCQLSDIFFVSFVFHFFSLSLNLTIFLLPNFLTPTNDSLSLFNFFFEHLEIRTAVPLFCCTPCFAHDQLLAPAYFFHRLQVETPVLLHEIISFNVINSTSGKNFWTASEIHATVPS